jgi:predicted DsbA family dithiol-disulfide isomerase
MPPEQEPIVVYADYVCPFCYLGRESLERYQDQREEPLPIEWHPFDLRAQKRGPDGEIDHSVDDGKDEEYFEQARKNVERLRERYDADAMLDFDDVPEVDSLDTQIVSLAVRREHPDAWEAFDDAIYRALWEEGRDVGDPDVLADIAAEVDVPPATVRDALADEELRSEIFERFEAASGQGVTGVPTFAYEGYAARGAVPPEQLRRLVEGE